MPIPGVFPRNGRGKTPERTSTEMVGHQSSTVTTMSSRLHPPPFPAYVLPRHQTLEPGDGTGSFVVFTTDTVYRSDSDITALWSPYTCPKLDCTNSPLRCSTPFHSCVNTHLWVINQYSYPVPSLKYFPLGMLMVMTIPLHRFLLLHPT